MTTAEVRVHKRNRAILHARKSAEATARILRALEKGRKPKLADAKMLEAAGCYIRRNVV